MITRPLDLSSRLRPAPRNLDALFWVNGGLIALFFTLFGSRFVLSPGLPLTNEAFALPTMGGAVESAVATSVVVSLPRPGMALTDAGLFNYGGLRGWLEERGAAAGGAGRLLIQADASVPMQDWVALHDMARRAGFQSVQLATQVSETAAGAPR